MGTEFYVDLTECTITQLEDLNKLSGGGLNRVDQFPYLMYLGENQYSQIKNPSVYMKKTDFFTFVDLHTKEPETLKSKTKLCNFTLETILSDCEKRLSILKDREQTSITLGRINENQLIICYLQEKLLDNLNYPKS